jgi:DNA-binding transcriptional MerR regulator
MIETPPNLPPENVYCVKQVCAEIGVSKTTLAKYRRRGLITPLNPDNPRRFKYSGQSVNELYYILSRL